jgi:hypothetical protein
MDLDSTPPFSDKTDLQIGMPIMTPFFRYIVLATGFTVLAINLSLFVTREGQLWQFIALAILIASPTVMAMLYTDTVAITHSSTRLKPGSHLLRFTTSRILSTIVWVVWSVCFGCWTILWLSAAEPLEWSLLLAFIWVLYLINALIFLVGRTQLASYCVTAETLRLSRLIAAILITAAFLFIAHTSRLEHSAEPLSTRLDAISKVPLDAHKSYLVQLSVRIHAHLQAMQAYFIEQLKNTSSLYLVAAITGTFALFYNFSVLLSAFLIPGKEYRRAFAPIEFTATPPAVSIGTIVFTATVATLFAYVLFPIAANFEMYLRFHTYPEKWFHATESRVVQLAERIDNVLYRPGTIREIEQTRLHGLMAKSSLLPPVRRQSQLAFAEMRQNVDVFLDSYYSLSAEYLRIIGALTGRAEKVISDNLTNTLMSGEELAKLSQEINKAVAVSPEVSNEYRRRVAAILDRNRLSEPKGEISIVASSDHDLLSPLPEHPSLLTVNQRMQTSGVAAIGGVIVAKVVSKTAAKGGIKIAAKGLTKLATTKAASGPVGAAAGAAVGSVIPVVGTAVGAVIGFGVGAVIGISTDALLLKLEEHYSRDEFKAQLLQAIDEQEQEFNALLDGGTVL